MQARSTRALVWNCLRAAKAGEARRVLDAAEDTRGEVVTLLEFVAGAAEAFGLPDAAAAARARVGAATSDHEVALPPLPDQSLRPLADALHGFAGLVSTYGNFAIAEHVQLLAVDLYTELDGSVSAGLAFALAQLSSIHVSGGLAAAALRFATEANRVAEQLDKAGAPIESTGRARLTNALGAAHSACGQYDAAADCYQRAVAVFASVPSEREALALAVNNLGAIETRRGRLADAQRLLREALELRRKVLEPNDPATAETLQNLATLADHLHRQSLALDLYREALAIRQAAWPGLDHPLTAQSMSSVAALEFAVGDPEQAETLGNDALAMRRRLFRGTPHADLAESLNNVAHTHAIGGRLTEAIALWTEARAVLMRGQGGHAELWICLINLAQAWAALGDMAQARAAANVAVLTCTKRFSDDDWRVARALAVQSIVLAMGGDREAAFMTLRRARAIEHATYWRVVRMSSERGRAAYAGRSNALVDTMVSLLFSKIDGHDPAEVAEVADLILRRKRVELETRAALRQAIERSTEPDVAALGQLNADARAALVKLQLSGSRTSTAEEHEQRLLHLELLVEQSEAELIERLPAVDLGPTLELVSAARVADALPSGSAVVDIVRVREPEMTAGTGRYGPASRLTRYVAVVVRAADAQPDLVPLGEAEAVDRLVASFRRAIMEGQSEIGVGVALADQLIVPLKEHLAGVDRLYLAPDAALFELPFAALPLGGGTRVADLWELTYVTTGRELIGTPSQPQGDRTAPIVMGDPDFELGLVDGPTGAAPAFAAASLSFDRLKHTRAEAAQVAKVLGVSPLLDEDAREEALTGVHSPRILHLATHGFFLPSPSQGDGDVSPEEQPLPHNPLIRSGLLLAGAKTWCLGRTPVDQEDGILTAEEVSALDLRGTELVVLSACDSGLGRVQTGEGVQGLRSTFQLAGARTVIMSLWQVGDEVTAELMTLFYRSFTSGTRPATALAQAQAAMRELYPEDPFAWGAFVCQG